MLRMCLVLLIVVVSVTLCADWQYLGLSDYSIFKVRLENDYIYATTDNGLFRKNITDPDTVWANLGFEETLLGGLFVVNDSTYLVSIIDAQEEKYIYRTDDGGRNWVNFQNGVKFKGNLIIRDFTGFFNDEEIILASGNASVIRYTDDDDEWDLVYGAWHDMGMGIHFLHIDPNKQNVVWGGGETAFFAPFLIMSEDYGENWKQIDIDASGDNACHIIAIDPNNSDVLYVGMEGRIIKSVDGGKEWEIVFCVCDEPELSYDFWGLAVSKHNSDIVYATVHTRNVYQHIKILISYDAGKNWSIIKGDFGRYMTMSMDYRFLEDADELYIGTIGGGVFKFLNDKRLKPFPNAASNPYPENKAMDISVELDQLKWSYVVDSLYIDPIGFKVYYDKNEDFDRDEYLWVDYEKEQIDYWISIPIELSYSQTYYWQIIPTAADKYGDKEEKMIKDAVKCPLWSFTTEIETSIGELQSQTVTELKMNYPNPFNPNTLIKYSLHEKSSVKILVYNIDGRLVKRIYHGMQESGTYTVNWDGTDESDSPVSSGIYFYRLKTDTHVFTNKMVLVK